MILGGALTSGLGGWLGGSGGANSRAIGALRDIARQQRDLATQNYRAVEGLLPTLAPDYVAGQRQAAVGQMLGRAPMADMPAGPAAVNPAAVAARSGAAGLEQAKAAAEAGRRERMMLPADQQRAAALAARAANERIALNNAYAQALQAAAMNAGQAAAAGSGSDFAGLLTVLGPLLSLFGAVNAGSGGGGVPLPALSRKGPGGLLGGGV